MILATLMQKNGLRQVATLTVATPATLSADCFESVAKVASVAVANAEIEKSVVVEGTAIQAIAPDTATADDVFFMDDRRHCSACGNLSAGRCMAAWRGDIEAGQYYRPVDTLPRRCMGFVPLSSDLDKRTGEERWPGLAI